MWPAASLPTCFTGAAKEHSTALPLGGTALWIHSKARKPCPRAILRLGHTQARKGGRKALAFGAYQYDALATRGVNYYPH